MRSTAMIMLIVLAASFLNFVMSATGLTDALVQSITGLGLSPGWMLLIVVIFYLVLGCFMETLSMMITTIPIVAPIMIALGYDPIWLGILIIVLVEAAPHHAARRPEPVRGAKPAQKRFDDGRHQRRAAIRAGHVRHAGAAGLLPRPGAVAAARGVRVIVQGQARAMAAARFLLQGIK